MCLDDRLALTTTAQLRAEGWSRRSIAAAVVAGDIERVRRGTYARDTACAPVRRAGRHGGVLACVSAARHLGLWTLADDDTLHVWLRGDGHAVAHDGCCCVEHWDAMAAPGRTRAASVPRVLRQIWLCRGIEEFFVTLESALHQRRITRAGLAWLRTHCGEPVRDAIAFARSDAESGLESLLRWRLRECGLRIRTQVWIVSVGRVDILVGDRLILEADGAAFHDGAQPRHRDRVRDANAAAWGYVTLRFDYAMIVHDWPTVLGAILAHIDRGHHR